MRRPPILLRIALVSLFIGAYALVRNLLATWDTMQDYPNASFLPVFLSTQSGTGGTDWILVYYVWGPVVFGGIGIVLLVAHFITRGIGAAAAGGAAGATAHAWAQPQQVDGQPQQGWQQQPAPQQQGWQPQQQQANPVQPLGGTQPPPPSADDRIQP